jgi:hypothetical protein
MLSAWTEQAPSNARPSVLSESGTPYFGRHSDLRVEASEEGRTVGRETLTPRLPHYSTLLHAEIITLRLLLV